MKRLTFVRVSAGYDNTQKFPSLCHVEKCFFYEFVFPLSDIFITQPNPKQQIIPWEIYDPRSCE